MDVGRRDQLEGALVAGIMLLAVEGNVRDVALLPRLQLVVHRGGIDARAQLHIDPARGPTPAGQIAIVLREHAREIDADQHPHIHVRVLGEVLEHAGDAVIGLLARSEQRQGAADDVPGAEDLVRLVLAQHHRSGPRERLAVALRHRQRDRVEKGAVDQPALIDLPGLAVLEQRERRPTHIGGALDLREILEQRPLGHIGRALVLEPVAGGLALVIDLELIGAPRIGQPIVVAALILDVEQDQQAGRQADRQAEQVDEGIGAVLRKRAQADRQIVAPHGLSPLPEFQAARRRSWRTRPSSMLTMRPA